MSDQARLSFESVALLTTSTVNTLHFPGLSTDGPGSRRTSFLLDGIGMCESMTESFCSTGGGQDDVQHTDPMKLERRDSTRKRRSRKSQYDATIEGVSLDKIETVNLFDASAEPDDAWLIDMPIKREPSRENIFSWVHKEFQSNDINANKHRLLCKLDDMSNARTIRSLSCHNFLENVTQPVHSSNGRLSSPIRSKSPVHENASRERLDYTDLEVMAKVQLENLRQADRQVPLAKPLGGSTVSLASTKPSATKPPLAPKSAVIRSTIRPNSYQRANTQTVVHEPHPAVESKPPVTLATRVSLLPNSANNNRTRPPIYRGSQTNLNTLNGKPQNGSSSIQRPTKPPSTEVSNGLLNDVSNKPFRSQVGPQRRTMLPQTAALPRSSSSSFSQGRKSGIPTTVDKPQKPTTSNLTRRPITTTSSSRNLSRSRIPTPVSWNDGCY